MVIKLALSSNFYSRDDFLVAGAILSDSLSRSGVNPNFNCASPTDCRRSCKFSMLNDIDNKEY